MRKLIVILAVAALLAALSVFTHPSIWPHNAGWDCYFHLGPIWAGIVHAPGHLYTFAHWVPQA